MRKPRSFPERIGVLSFAVLAAAGVGVVTSSGPASAQTRSAQGLPYAMQPRVEQISNRGFNAVKCFSATSCDAVGGDSFGIGHPLALHGNPATWGPAQVRTTNLPPAYGTHYTRGYLNALSCNSAIRCVAVGSDGNEQPLVMLGNPANWTAANARQITLPAAFKTATQRAYGDLLGISCFRALTQCTAVGWDGKGQPLELRGNPATWTAANARQVTLTGAFQGGQFDDISCVSYWSCVAVGKDGTPLPLTIYGNPGIAGAGTVWAPSAEESALPAGFGGRAELSGVSCPRSISFCVAVGNSGGGVDLPMSMVGNPAHAAWTNGADAFQVSDPGAGVTSGSFWSEVDCTTTTYCVAVGQEVGLDGNGDAFSDQGNPAQAAWNSTGADTTQITLLGGWAGDSSAAYGDDCLGLLAAPSTTCVTVGDAPDPSLAAAPLTDYGIPGIGAWWNGTHARHP